MATKITLTYNGMPGEGRTVTEAKRDAGRRIEAALERLDETPRTLRWRGHTLIMYPTREGYAYTILWAQTADEAERIDRTTPCTHYEIDPSADAVWKSATRHLAQAGYRRGDTTAPEFVTDRYDAAQTAEDYRTHNEYHDLVDRGIPKEIARRYALRDPYNTDWQAYATDAELRGMKRMTPRLEQAEQDA